MKILYAATDQDLASIHGGTVHVCAVTSELVRNGHKVHLLIQKTSRARSVPEGSTLHEIPQMNRYLLWKAGPQIQTLLQDIRPNVVIERYYNFAGEAIIRAKEMRIPSMLEVNSPMIEYPGSLKSKVDLLLAGALQRRRTRIAASASLILTPMPEIVPWKFRDKIREIEWGADTNLFDPESLPDRAALRTQLGFSPDEIVLIHFGSLRKWHGLTKLLEAFDAARNHFKQRVRLVVIGPLVKEKALQRTSVHFAGIVPHEQVPGWLKASDLAVFPFDTEQHRYLELGFFWSPLKLFEAMAMQLPILTLKHERLISLLGTDDPDFFYDGSMRNLSTQLTSAAEKLTSMTEKAKHFRERIQNNYSWEIHGKKLNELLLSVASKQ